MPGGSSPENLAHPADVAEGGDVFRVGICLATADSERRTVNAFTEADVECVVVEAVDCLRLQESHPRIRAKVLETSARCWRPSYGGPITT